MFGMRELSKRESSKSASTDMPTYRPIGLRIVGLRLHSGAKAAGPTSTVYAKYFSG